MIIGAPPPAIFDLIIRTRRPLLTHVAARVAGPLWAEDVVQEAALRAWRALPRFRGGADEMARWLVTVTANTARDWCRAQQARPQTGPILPGQDWPGDDGPEALALRREAAAEATRRATALLAPLRPRRRRVLWQMGALEQSATTVARRWGESPLAIKYVWLRAAKRCRDAAPLVDSGRDGNA